MNDECVHDNGYVTAGSGEAMLAIVMLYWQWSCYAGSVHAILEAITLSLQGLCYAKSAQVILAIVMLC